MPTLPILLRLLLLLLSLLVLLSSSAASSARADVHTDAPADPTAAASAVAPDDAGTTDDRAHTYPDGVASVRHDPSSPSWGQDVRVTIEFDDDRPAPDRVTLLYCRVEPTYACALPVPATPRDDHVWLATIAWDDRFMQPGLQHIGYNLTIGGTAASGGEPTRTRAPTVAHAQPDTFPRDVDAAYYFYRISGAPDDGIAAELPPIDVLPIMTAAYLMAALHRKMHATSRAGRVEAGGVSPPAVRAMPDAEGMGAGGPTAW